MRENDGANSWQTAGHEFNEFAFAPLVESEGNASLSMISVLAGLDIDVWHKAAELARLSRVTATHRLARLIAKVLNQDAGRLDAGAASVRLIALLPRTAKARSPSSCNTSQGYVSAYPGSLIIGLCVAFGIISILLAVLILQFIWISRTITEQ